MIKDHIQQYIDEQQSNVKKGSITLFKEEKEYAEKNQLAGNLQLSVQDASVRFADAYIERCDKETEN
ncbi:MAG: branched-chain amino acid aminotransferase, partial [Bacillus sp. (in: firmicutes)]